MNVIALLYLAWGLGFAAESRAEADPELLKKADAFYQAGNCIGAVNAYRDIYYQQHPSPADRDLVIFRTSYCYLQLGQTEAAAKGFQDIVDRYPQNDEARLRLAQALFQLRRAATARDHALLVEAEPLRAEATLLAAQADLELGDYQLAFNRLNRAQVNADWKPIFLYWLGIAKFRIGNSKQAEAYFRMANNLSPPGLWVKKESVNWIDQIHGGERTLHGSLTFGYFIDSNVAQQSVLTTNNSGVPIESAPKPSSYYKDTGFLLAADASWRILQNEKWSLFSLANFSTPLYRLYTSYDNENLSGGLTGSYRFSPATSADLSAKYLNSRYHFKYS